MPRARIELANLSAGDFKSPVFTISPPGQLDDTTSSHFIGKNLPIDHGAILTHVSNHANFYLWILPLHCCSNVSHKDIEKLHGARDYSYRG